MARFWSARVGEQLLEDVVWSYPDPIPENPGAVAALDILAREAGRDVTDWDTPPEKD